MFQSKINRTQTELKHNTIAGAKAAVTAVFQVPKWVQEALTIKNTKDLKHLTWLQEKE